MAKRKRLGPATLVGGEAALTGGSGSVSAPPPIAHVAGSAASEAAARDLADELVNARAEGRLVQDIPLDQIDETHLTRDRIAASQTDMAALEASIEARGQQMPVELVDLGAQANPRYGLISGWRRLTALKRLHDRTGEARFASARAVLRRPATAAEAYLSMVEENELRVGLSYYERAQVAARAAQLGVFETSAEAIQALFPTASKAKRSKINAFVRIFQVLDPVLGFPEHLPERLGLRVAKALDAGQGSTLFTGLQEGGPFADPQAEQARIERLLSGRKKGSDAQDRVEKTTFPGGVTLTQTTKGLTLSGAGADATLALDLAEWLQTRQAGRG